SRLPATQRPRAPQSGAREFPRWLRHLAADPRSRRGAHGTHADRTQGRGSAAARDRGRGRAAPSPNATGKEVTHVNVAGKVVAVTGGANGIGRALALRFAREGARHVAIADLDENGAAS